MDDITILMPVKDQKHEFLMAAVESVLRQTDPRWHLLAIINEDSPADIRALLSTFTGDGRIRLIVTPRPSFAAALNTGLSVADTAFVSILLSDDLYDPSAIEVLHHYMQRHPRADFFHSARRYTDASGHIRTPIMPSRTFCLKDFTRGSPVKHLLCWRRTLGRAVGLDESLSEHGCDDYDFPWRMAERGCRFQAVRECLYQVRIHHDFRRLTTQVTFERQLAILRTMFHRHGVSAHRTERYMQRAINGYLVRDKHMCYESDRTSLLGLAQVGWFEASGYALHCLPRVRPDAMYLSMARCGLTDPGQHWELQWTRYEQPMAPGLRFFRPQLSQARALAVAAVVHDGHTVTVLDLDTDGSWHDVRDGLLEFCWRRQASTLRWPVGPAGAAVRAASARRRGDWWVLSVGRAPRVKPVFKEEITEWGKTICLCHAGTEPRAALLSAIEQRLGVRGTYALPRSALDSMRPVLAVAGHGCAYRMGSNDAAEASSAGLSLEDRLRLLQGGAQHGVRGYWHFGDAPVPSAAALCLANFSWMAAPVETLGYRVPRLEDHVVKVPWVALPPDQDWEEQTIGWVKQQDVVAVVVPETLAVERYDAFLTRILSLGSFRTVDAMVDDLVWSGSRL